MKEITLKVKNEKYKFFMELIKSLDFVQVDEEVDSKEEIIANIRQGFKEMKAIEEGTMEATSLQDFLDEL
ncbi:hypothetical protein M3O96_07770 [Aquiflexum sp. TKW24L]|uniref:hypothetical protein n=1 Tax=Aquiflexum sp. TKW24L TaxID=2942212 RepID=UPI0020C0B00F|nr:hypothetical protein [Aquiflexum sp. TKW24L]MCL6258978.1 hypothetical protein [Aquiflexum sp. TKW24L]